ncbi:LysM peptidoglycan-binding domain-containing protein [Bacillus timonensis]|uniref:LysM peptidoglycan-binding domain-containing protein n=1 Tax=Bacillus timonensis TaxID=1033734 RepID=A0A4V3V8N6_9BACI|nr:M14 family metallopeptidase [Bacillus timonensis]THE15473.1 LysM peptidoglycan-binding domain-containing protein [Bacillus timonensis]
MKVKVRPGDTLWYYSQLFAIPSHLLTDSNLHVNSTNLQVGETVSIPGFVTKPYTISAGDTLWKLAKSRTLLADALFLVNPEIEAENLQIGQTIQLPERVVDSIVKGNRKYDFEDLMRDVQDLQVIYPFLQPRSIGKSVLGKELVELRLGRGTKRVHWNGSFHANEWITTNVIMTFLNEYLLALTNMRSIRGFYVEPLYLEAILSIVPMVNPDGVDLVLHGPSEQEPYKQQVIDINKGSLDFKDWKANIRGVDLNNQFPANWEIEKKRKEPKAPAPRDYPGDAPLTEPEVIAIEQLIRSSNFSSVLAFHTQGEVIYWGYEGLEPPNAETLVKEFSRVSGYEAVRFVDSHAGFKDWFIQEWRRPGFTFELGKGVNPLPLSQFEEIYQETLGAFLASLYMG